MDPNDAILRDLIAEYRLPETRLGDPALYQQARNVRRVSARLTERQPVMAAYT
ncbi:hypothetical protein ACWDUL_16260 [Nocardia niigatensis]|uniref:hypothetical protein n=1 Tax=Nocardia niigatensis TaxID=209249 RepID=UPI0002DC602C|nr:hypothetical protein [Nocardia niigatensis]